jgi:hypothetical protein
VPRHRTRSARCTLQQRPTRCASVPARPLCRPVSASASRDSVHAPPGSSPRGPPRAPVKRGLARLRTARRPSHRPAPSPLARTHAARPTRREQDQPRTGGRGLRARAERLPARALARARASKTSPRAKRPNGSKDSRSGAGRTSAALAMRNTARPCRQRCSTAGERKSWAVRARSAGQRHPPCRRNWQRYTKGPASASPRAARPHARTRCRPACTERISAVPCRGARPPSRLSHYRFGAQHAGGALHATAPHLVAVPRGGRAVSRRSTSLRSIRPSPPPPFPSRTKWTRLVHTSVLIGHVSSLTP